jgi:hypothetical protein
MERLIHKQRFCPMNVHKSNVGEWYVLFTDSECYVLNKKTYLYKYGTAMQLHFTVKLYWLV